MTELSQYILRYIELGVREWITLWNYSITQNFIAGGRPGKWAATRRGGKILMKSNRLHSSISVKYEKTGQTLFRFVASTNIKYGRIHQFGGWIRPKNAKALTIPISAEAKKRNASDWPKTGPGALFKKKNAKGTKMFLCTREGRGHNIKVKYHYILMKMVYIVGRPYMVVQEQDSRDFKDLMGNAVQSALKDRNFL